MTVDDFCLCTPHEFQAVYEGWAEAKKRRERCAWERTRMQCTCMLQPYSRHRLEPQDVLKFTWDDEDSDEGEHLTTTEIKERFEKVKMEQGLG